MYNNLGVGTRVTLTSNMKRAVTHLEKYEIGSIVALGSWGIVKVFWDGFDRAIDMRSDELKQIEED